MEDMTAVLNLWHRPQKRPQSWRQHKYNYMRLAFDNREARILYSMHEKREFLQKFKRLQGNCDDYFDDHMTIREQPRQPLQPFINVNQIKH